MGKLSISTIAVASFLATSASAADLGRGTVTDPTSVASEQPSRSWSGVYLGALGGYQFSNSALNYDADCFDDVGERVEGASIGVDGLGAEGLFGEIQLGFDKQVGTRLVLGAFAGLNLNDGEFEIDASRFVEGVPAATGSASILTFSQEWGGVLGARAGFLTTQNTMLYVAGGWAFGELSDLESGIVGGPSGTGGKLFNKQETDLNGYFVELGMETRISENVFFTVAGRYTDYGAITLAERSSDDCCGTLDEKLELDHDTLAVMAGLKIKLNSDNIGLGF